MKIGLDKIAHFGIGGWIAAMTTIVLTVMFGTRQGDWRTLLWGIAGFVLTAILAAFKELGDDKADIKDFIYSVAGAATVFVALAVGVLLSYTA